MKKGGGSRKGKSFEWATSRTFSLWMTRGEDKTQLMPSTSSGGWVNNTGSEAWRQAGDLAPNGPAGHEFRTRFAVECKHRKEIDLWWHWTRSPSDETIDGWWSKLRREILALEMGHDAPLPMLYIRANYRPVMIGLPMEFSFARESDGMVWPRMGLTLFPEDDFLTRDPDKLLAEADDLRKAGTGAWMDWMVE